ncbi:unnamed protein product [Pieris brassicae]|uniref:ABC transporter domain-containing protein n=1 Tax=Pieris brassicae TaxID=7116 RepID=A0A9P0XC32_PIEBR|nr:unnamed protein product [Pieris brassicae]
MVPDSNSVSTSASLTEDVNISFENITHIVRHSLLPRGGKTILNGVNGQFNAGELSVIIGQSGAGKSTLLDILAGYTDATGGNIFVNGRLRNVKLFRRRSCYILQDDRVQDMLTIHESLHFAAELKLGNHISTEQKNERIKEIVESLGVKAAIRTRAANLSGGQRKRLAIGLELVNDPPVMFLDEPISGLDVSTAYRLILLLRGLARQGRTIIISMHQPSATLLNKVDRLYALVEGRCGYMGSVSLLVPFLAENGLTCPAYHNPVDFFIEISDPNDKNNVVVKQMLVQQSDNGRNISYLQNTVIVNDKDDELVCLSTLPSPKEDPTNKILLALKSTYPTTSLKQFAILTRRTLLTIWRDPSFVLMNVSIHIMMALFVGTLFFKVGGDAKYMRDNFNFLYFSLMFLMFTAFSSATVRFPDQVPIARREHFNRWYNTGAYLGSTLASILPMQTISTLSFCLITYLLTGQPLESLRIAQYSFTLVLVSYVAVCVGLFNGSLFTVKNAVIFGPFLIMPFTVFSGFFLKFEDAPTFFQWIFHISFLKHGLVGLVLSIMGMERPKLACTDTYCHYAKPRQFLKDYDQFIRVSGSFETWLRSTPRSDNEWFKCIGQKIWALED